MMINADLITMMQEPLPSIGSQRRLIYRPTLPEVVSLYQLINTTIFDGAMTMPDIKLASRCRKYWGMCFGGTELVGHTNTYCTIKLMDKWYCKQWLITILAHEMCHQYQWDIYSNQRVENDKDRIMSHGPSFFIFKRKLAEHGISLKVAHRQRKWFMHQNLFK